MDTSFKSYRAITHTHTHTHTQSLSAIVRFLMYIIHLIFITKFTSRCYFSIWNMFRVLSCSHPQPSVFFVWWSTYVSVSYTHLDVYKRQTSNQFVYQLRTTITSSEDTFVFISIYFSCALFFNAVKFHYPFLYCIFVLCNVSFTNEDTVFELTGI